MQTVKLQEVQLHVQHPLKRKCSTKSNVQHRLHRSAAFAPQSAAVPAERAVLEAMLPKLRKVFVPKTKYILMEVNKLVFRMKTTITFGLVQKAALRKAEAALRRSRNCTLRQSRKSCTCFATSLET